MYINPGLMAKGAMALKALWVANPVAGAAVTAAVLIAGAVIENSNKK